MGAMAPTGGVLTLEDLAAQATTSARNSEARRVL
jgi:hypothetical protein